VETEPGKCCPSFSQSITNYCGGFILYLFAMTFIQYAVICNSVADSAIGSVSLHLLFNCLYIENRVTMRKVYVT
jgi:hypothetical protein